MLKAEHISVNFGDQAIVNDLSFELKEGQWLMLAGPNGAGKSTLINAVAQSVPCKGSIELLGRNIRSYKPAELARRLGVLSQHHHVGYAYTVEEIVSLGRYAHQSGFFASRDTDSQDYVDRAIEMTGMEPFRHKSILTLSGGEVQRAFLAQVFAQDPKVLILDEPANHLDLIYQKHIFSLIDQWRRQKGRAVISVVHDLSLARRYGTHAVLMDQGKCVAQGALTEVLTNENLQKVYRMDVYAWMQEMLSQWK